MMGEKTQNGLPLPAAYTASAPAQSLTKVDVCTTPIVINGELPVETNCWNCRNSVISRPLRVYEKTPNSILRYVSIVSMIIFIAVGIAVWALLTETNSRVSPTLLFGTFVGFAALTGLGLAALAYYGRSGEWRAVHYCPNCNKVLANVHAGSEPAMCAY